MPYPDDMIFNGSISLRYYVVFNTLTMRGFDDLYWLCGVRYLDDTRFRRFNILTILYVTPFLYE
jgi:hypothetical protein